MKRRATIKAKSPEEFERWRRLAQEIRRKITTSNNTTEVKKA